MRIPNNDIRLSFPLPDINPDITLPVLSITGEKKFEQCIEGNVPEGLKEYCKPKKIILQDTSRNIEYKATLQYYKNNIVLVEANPVNNSEVPKQFAHFMFDDGVVDTEEFDKWYEVAYPSENEMFFKPQSIGVEYASHFELMPNHFEKLRVKPSSVIDEGFQIREGLLREIERLRIAQINKPRIDNFKKLKEGLERILSKIEKTISYYKNYIHQRKRLLSEPKLIDEGRLKQLDELIWEDISKQSMVPIKMYIPPKQIVLDMTDGEYQYVRNKITFQEAVEELQELTKQYLGIYIKSEKGSPMAVINSGIESLIRNDFEVCLGKVLERLVLEDRIAISRKQSEELVLSPFIKRTLSGFLYRVHIIGEASQKLGQKANLNNEQLAFGAGDGMQDEIYIYDIQRAIDEPIFKYGFWLDLDTVVRTIEMAEKLNKHK